jgi:hypothetical protein
MTVSSRGPFESTCAGPTTRRLTIVNVIQRLLRIVRIVDNQRSTQPITVLVLEMTVIPESALEW